MAMNTICVFCNIPLSDGRSTVTLHDKGSQSVNESSIQCKDSIVTVSGQVVHTKCRGKYCHPATISAAQASNTKDKINHDKHLRSSEKSFNVMTDCLYCATAIDDAHEYYHVVTTTSQDTILKQCSSRKDIWAERVRASVLHVHDLHAADTVYHQVCSVNFRTGKCLPQSFTDGSLPKKPRIGILKKLKNKEGGRKTTDDQYSAFIRVAEQYVHNDDEQTTISDLEGSLLSAYSENYMKTKLREHFGDRIIITTINGKSNVVTMRRTAESILLEFRNNHNEDQSSEKNRIIEAASKFILEDIKAVDTLYDIYPSTSQLETESCLHYLPHSLR